MNLPSIKACRRLQAGAALLLFLLSLFLAGDTPVFATVSEDVLPQAGWISATPAAEKGQVAFIRKTFAAPPGGEEFRKNCEGRIKKEGREVRR